MSAKPPTKSPITDKLSKQDAEVLAANAAKVFQPRTPISRREALAGRWDQLERIRDSVNEVGLHILIYGERGVGKTSIANVLRPLMHYFDDPKDEQKLPSRVVVCVNSTSDDSFSDLWRRAFNEVRFAVTIENANAPFGFQPIESSKLPAQEISYRSLPEHLGLPLNLTIDDVRQVVSKLTGAVFAFDEFDRVQRPVRREFTDLIKTLSDKSIDCTVILVGVAETIEELVEDHESIRRATTQIKMPRMSAKELSAIIKRAEIELQIKFEQVAAEQIVNLSQGLPHYTHLVGLHSVRNACKDLTRIVTSPHVTKGYNSSVIDAEQTIKKQYLEAATSSQPEALYSKVLLACAMTAFSCNKELGMFQPVDVCKHLEMLLGRDNVQVGSFNKHLTEFCDDPKRGRILERKGEQRSFRYRFRDPLMPPYVLMQGVIDGFITQEEATTLMTTVPD